MILLSLVYFSAAVYISTSFLGEMLPFHVVYRVIYIPAAFWAATFFYALLFRARTARPVSAAMILTLGIPVHLAVLLLNSYFSIVITAVELGAFYKFYIAALMCVSLFFALFWGSKITGRKSDFFFLPAVYIFPYAVYLAYRNNSIASLAAFLVIAASVYIIDSSNKVSGIFLKFLDKAKAAIKYRRNALLLIFIFAFSIRLLFGMNIIHRTGSDYPIASDDGDTYDRHASCLAKDPSYIRNPGFMPSGWDAGYSLLLAFLYKIFGRSFHAVMIIQCLIGAAVPVMAYLLSDIVIKKKAVSLLSAVWCSLDQTLIMLSAILGQEAFYIPLVLCLVFLVTRYAAKRHNKIDWMSGLLIGASFGIAVVIRSAILFFLPLAIVYIMSLRGDKSFMKKSAEVFVIVFIAAAIIAPVTYINYMNSGKFYLLTKPKAILEWECPEGPGYFFPGNAELARIGINPVNDLKGSAANIIRDPLRFLSVEGSLLARRYVGFFFCYNFGYFDPIYLVNPARIPNGFASNLEFYIALAVFGGFLYIMANGKMRKAAWPMALIVLYYVLIHVVITRMGSSRYRGPVHPYLIIFGAMGISILFEYIKKGFKSRAR